MAEPPLSSDGEIAVVTTGGTIGSVLSGSVREVNRASNDLIYRVNTYRDELGVEFNFVPAMNVLSENMEPADWASIGREIEQCIEAGYEGIIVTHGTDTMVYTASAVHQALGDVQARIVFTGSFYGPDESDNEVELAVKSSIEASIAESLPDGVYIDFRSPHDRDRAHIHRAVDTRPMYMDDSGFQSLFGRNVGAYTEDGGWSWTNATSPTANLDYSGLGGIPDEESLSNVVGRVQKVSAIPGQVLPWSGGAESVPDVLIVDLYHSGTASDSRHPQGLRDFIQEFGDTTEVLLVGLSRKVVSPPYESTKELVSEGARVIQDVQPHVVYTAMYMGLALGLDVNEILRRSPGREARFTGKGWAVGAADDA